MTETTSAGDGFLPFSFAIERILSSPLRVDIWPSETTGNQQRCGTAEKILMEGSELAFGVWWYLVWGGLGIALWIAGRRGARADGGHLLQTFLIGVAAALALFLLPGATDGADSSQGLELRFLCALAIAWLAGEFMTRRGHRPGGFSAVAVAGFAGVNVVPLAFYTALMMVSGGNPGGF
jgi:hypothetical protein